jgi:hypothetical protein
MPDYIMRDYRMTAGVGANPQVRYGFASFPHEFVARALGVLTR